MIQFRGLSIGRGRGLMAIAAETGQRYGDEVRGAIAETILRPSGNYIEDSFNIYCYNQFRAGSSEIIAVTLVDRY
jgi:hypothetical protein